LRRPHRRRRLARRGRGGRRDHRLRSADPSRAAARAPLSRRVLNEVSNVRSMTSVDGVITPTEDARIPVLDRGFLYGDSVYEVFRTYRGVPLFYEEHWDRFKNSASLIHLELGLTLEELTRRIKRTIAASGALESRT